jgi:hypothetical protein
VRPMDSGVLAVRGAVFAALVGCLRPSAGTPAVAAGVAQTGADEGTQPVGQRLVLWDGSHIKPRNRGMGRGAGLDFWDGGKGWADCDSKPNCEAALAAKAGVGIDGGKGLQFHAHVEGSGWAGSGWSWFGWYPPTAGTDLSAYRSLTFEIRVEPKSPDTGPDTEKVAVLLVCSNGKRTTARAAVQKYDGKFDDGKWHKIAIPIADLRSGDGADFDATTVWEFRLSTWSDGPRDFDIYIDQIAAEK